ncbi:MAG: hypothetical protein OQL19_02025 [Gammaproteobacteria bacterium]|nr:hypothetical protein [Gammaproteobacteria bacterium]
MERRTLLMVISSFLIAMLLFAGYYKIELAKKNNIIAQIEPDKSCDLQKTACTLKIPNGGDVTLSIEPRPIPVVKNFKINVNTNEVEAQAISIDFKGTTMNMGPNSVKLKAQSQSGHFLGKGMLPVCVRNSMEWQADVYIQTNEGILVAPFIFVTTH